MSSLMLKLYSNIYILCYVHSLFEIKDFQLKKHLNNLNTAWDKFICKNIFLYLFTHKKAAATQVNCQT